MDEIGNESAPVRWRFANAEYNERNHELIVAGEAVALEPKPLEVLLCLLRAEGELVTKQELFDTVWAERVVTDGVLSQAIRRIREVLGDAERTMLRTVHGYGFRLDVPIEIEGRDDPGTRLQLEAGQSLPNLPHWILEERLQTRPANELWRIRHAQSQQHRVVKLALDERAQRALKREVTLNKVLRAELGEDAPLVPLLEWQFESSPAWIQMPWYEQGSLVDWLEAHGGPASLPMERRLKIVAEAAEALAKAHALGVMHKDIKPGNLLVEHSAEEPRLLLCDFGSGTVKSRERLEQTGVTVMGFTKTVHADSSTSGTPAYMAPEVLKGGVFSEQSDVYAVGILLYQLVISDLTEPMAPGWEEDVADPGLRALIAEACAGKPARRIRSMQELAQRLRAWAPASGSPRPAQTQTPEP
ncbi:MAG: protein kinase domain-containing protein, partial [Oceanococcaceae bacterium]